MNQEESKTKQVCEPYYEDDEIDLYELWLVIKKRKKLILGLFFSVVVLTVVVSFIMTPIYRSTATVIPISDSKSSLGSLGSLAAVAGLAGISLGESDESQKVLAVLNSRTIKENVIKRLDLIAILAKDVSEDRRPLNVAIEEFEKILSITQDKKTGVISISVDFKDPKIATQIVNAYIQELQKILNEKALTVAKMNRIFLEKQLKEEEERLKKYQYELAQFQRKTKLIEPKEQLKGTMELYAGLIAQKISLQVQLRQLESALSDNNPKIQMIREQLKAIDSQIKKLEEKSKGAFPSIADVPEKMTQYLDLLRKLKTSEAIYETLLKAYEQAKFEEAKKSLYVQIIDEPFIPDKPIKPKKALMVAVAGVGSLFIGIFLAFFLEWIENIKRRHQSIE
ncbi:MAG: hypothetical protein GXO22_07720 [Aquificae bacterium]|nr:hypothetical protein [Aquificota bacterium]